MGVKHSIQAISVSHPFSMNKKIDQFLSERLPDLMDEHKLADRSDLMDLDKDFQGIEARMEELEGWKKGFEVRISEDEHRIERIKYKLGLK